MSSREFAILATLFSVVLAASFNDAVAVIAGVVLFPVMIAVLFAMEAVGNSTAGVGYDLGEAETLLVLLLPLLFLSAVLCLVAAYKASRKRCGDARVLIVVSLFSGGMPIVCLNVF